MTADPAQLLRQLEPAVRPAFASGPAARPRTPLEHQRFDELLAQAAQGSVRSGRGVGYAYPVAEQLDDAQTARLATAADLAEASGAQQALMLIDGRGMVLDVPNRLLTGELSAHGSSRLVKIDAAVYVANDDEEGGDAPLVLSGGIAPPAVARQIEAAHSGDLSSPDTRHHGQSTGV